MDGALAKYKVAAIKKLTVGQRSWALWSVGIGRWRHRGWVSGPGARAQGPKSSMHRAEEQSWQGKYIQPPLKGYQ